MQQVKLSKIRTFVILPWWEWPRRSDETWDPTTMALITEAPATVTRQQWPARSLLYRIPAAAWNSSSKYRREMFHPSVWGNHRTVRAMWTSSRGGGGASRSCCDPTQVLLPPPSQNRGTPGWNLQPVWSLWVWMLRARGEDLTRLLRPSNSESVEMFEGLGSLAGPRSSNEGSEKSLLIKWRCN